MLVMLDFVSVFLTGPLGDFGGHSAWLCHNAYCSSGWINMKRYLLHIKEDFYLISQAALVAPVGQLNHRPCLAHGKPEKTNIHIFSE